MYTHNVHKAQTPYGLFVCARINIAQTRALYEIDYVFYAVSVCCMLDALYEISLPAQPEKRPSE